MLPWYLRSAAEQFEAIFGTPDSRAGAIRYLLVGALIDAIAVIGLVMAHDHDPKHSAVSPNLTLLTPWAMYTGAGTLVLVLGLLRLRGPHDTTSEPADMTGGLGSGVLENERSARRFRERIIACCCAVVHGMAMHLYLGDLAAAQRRAFRDRNLPENVPVCVANYLRAGLEESTARRLCP